jgi:hypothetical protein
MGRYQRGHILEQHGAFHVRYYTTEIVDGQPKRAQRSERLCLEGNKHHSRLRPGGLTGAMTVSYVVSAGGVTLLGVRDRGFPSAATAVLWVSGA